MITQHNKLVMDFAMRPSSSSSSTSSRRSFGAGFVVVTLLFGCWCCCYHGIPVVEAFALVSTSTSTTTPTSSSTRSSIAPSPTWSAYRRRHYATSVSVSTSASASTNNRDPSSSSMFVPDPATAALKQELYTLCAGTRNGVDADAGRKQEIQRVVTELEVLGQQRWTEHQQQHTVTAEQGNEQEQEQEDDVVTMTDVSLRGSRHELLYCESAGGSSGKIGPFVGYVEQIFADEDATNFINAVTLGPLQLALAATRTRVPDGIRYRVKFQHITVTIFGITVVTKPITGSGIWTSRFVDNELRIIDTPSLFIIRRLQDDDQKQHPQQQKSSASSSPSLVDILKNPADFIADDE